MKFKDVHHDVERYLAHDCYCPNEIYDVSGFFYMLFPADSECTIIAQNDKKTALLMTDKNNPYIVILWHEGDTIENAEHLDGTENNLSFAKKYIDDTLVQGKDHIDCFDPDGYNQTMEQMMALCNGVIIRD